MPQDPFVTPPDDSAQIKNGFIVHRTTGGTNCWYVSYPNGGKSKCFPSYFDARLFQSYGGDTPPYSGPGAGTRNAGPPGGDPTGPPPPSGGGGGTNGSPSNGSVA